MPVVKLRLLHHDWYSSIIGDFKGTTIEFLGISLLGANSIHALLKINSLEFKDLLESINKHSSVKKLKHIGGPLVYIITEAKGSPYKIILDSGCILTTNPLFRDSCECWKFFSLDRGKIKKALDGLKKVSTLDRDITLKEMDVEQFEILTKKQRRVLELALERGYYDVPKRINKRELAKIVKISTSTLSETLNRAEKRLIGTYFAGELKLKDF